ncbi:MAG: ABC transporter ATP-binding protein [Clostridiales bacterium]|nr:ABC transporter ATP-binding protein [Clostridiales bacterium]HBM81086.1 ABC transporter ATP-binding protein [Clostridiaceae bacterium]
MKPIIEVKNLSIDFKVKNGILRACDKISITINDGEILGIIGESGSGKSTFASGILNLVANPGVISEGQIIYHTKDGESVDLLSLSQREYSKYRWTHLASVFQAAQNALNPVLTIKDHFLETAWAHDSKIKREEVISKAKKIMKQVRLEERVLDYYPHQLSGGMKQRAIIALSLLLDPEILILDEPTTALDVITQWYIIDILRKIHNESGITMIFLTHDVSIIGSIVDRIGVMYAGQVVECGDVEDVFKNPSHPYTYGLMHAVPSLHDDISKRKAISGYPPDLLNLPDRCRFSERCMFYISGRCQGDKERTDKLYPVKEGWYSRCYLWREVLKL